MNYVHLIEYVDRIMIDQARFNYSFVRMCALTFVIGELQIIVVAPQNVLLVITVYVV